MNIWYMFIIIWCIFFLVGFIYMQLLNHKETGREKKLLPYWILFGVLLINTISFFSYYVSIYSKKDALSSDIVFLLDVSSSMDALDYMYEGKQISRLDTAKAFIKKYINDHPNNRYALTLFSGEVNDSLPLTTDKNLIYNIVDTVNSSSILVGGTKIGEGMKYAGERFDKDSVGGAVFLMSDFEIPNISEKEKSIYLSEINMVSQSWKKKNIHLVGIGLGNTNGTKIIIGTDLLGEPIYKKDNNKKEIVTVFDKAFFDTIIQIFSGQKLIFAHYDDMLNGGEKIMNLPSSQITIETPGGVSLSWSFMFGAYILFILYLFTYYFTRKLGKRNMW